MYLKSLKNITTKLTIFYDATCPLCLAEIHLLKHHNHKKLLEFIDIHSLDPANTIIDCQLALQKIHAKLGEQLIVVGPEVFFEAYKRTDLRLVNYLFSFAIFRFAYAKFYWVFAKYRHQISKLIGPSLLKIAQKKYPI